MELRVLAQLITAPELHRQLLGHYKGAYSLGIGQLPKHPGKHALILSVVDEPSESFPKYVVLNGEKVPVLIEHDFSVAKPLATTY
ncbi:hypothetical protein OKW30_001428 [Paraburkholderia sp. Clong3]|uniref:hypothetical protein n=1 Tax=Paraburkholderia sp. Clong3 TaxID=2991061 RepID=UPI003D1FD3F6